MMVNKHYRVQKLPSGIIALLVGDDSEVSFENYTEYKIDPLTSDDFLYERFDQWSDCYAYGVESLSQILKPFRLGGFLFKPTHTVRVQNLTLATDGSVYIKSYFEDVRGTISRVDGVLSLQDTIDQFKFVFP